MLRSSWFINIKRWYNEGSWNLLMVKNAVVKGKISKSEYEEITGKKY